MKTSSFVLPAALLMLAAACGVDDDASASSDPTALAAQAPAAQAPAAPDEFFSWKTGEFELGAGKERYLCFTKVLEEDLVIDGYSTKGAPYVHHVIFSRNRVPAKEGFEECNETFRMTWDPVFLTGAGAATLDFPRDAGHRLPKGTTMVVQMHLLNASEEPVKDVLEIKMRRSKVANPRPVNSYVFGSPVVNIAPNSYGQVVGNCKMPEKIEVIAAFPHMHMLGTSLTFETGKTEAELKTVFKREPYSFDNQAIEPLPLTLSPGDLTRVTCKYKNTTNQVIKYGESSLSEMCFFLVFAVDRPQNIGGCMEVLPPLNGSGL